MHIPRELNCECCRVINDAVKRGKKVSEKTNPDISDKNTVSSVTRIGNEELMHEVVVNKKIKKPLTSTSKYLYMHIVLSIYFRAYNLMMAT